MKWFTVRLGEYITYFEDGDLGAGREGGWLSKKGGLNIALFLILVLHEGRYHGNISLVHSPEGLISDVCCFYWGLIYGRE